MTTKIAVAILHGIGDQTEDFSDVFSEEIVRRFSQNIKPYFKSPETEIVIQPVYWGNVFNEKENEMWDNLSKVNALDFPKLRQFVIHFFGDAIAYQPSQIHNPNYNKVHEVFAKSLKSLSQQAGGDSPLFIVGHSLGSVIASNYLYDLEYIPDQIPASVRDEMGDSPLEFGETLTSFYSLGSPLALWSLRYADFDKPITVPSEKLKNYYPTIEGEWVNLYDKDDVFGYPLKSLNAAYEHAVIQDIEINSGNLLTSWSPLSHMYYFKTHDVINRIGDSLAESWKKINL